MQDINKSILSYFGEVQGEQVYQPSEVAEKVLECDVGHVYDLMALERRQPGCGLRAVNIGAASKPVYRITSTALLDFLARREGKVEVAATPPPLRRRGVVGANPAEGFGAMVEQMKRGRS